MSNYQRSSFPGCCGVNVVHELGGITAQEIKHVTKYCDKNNIRRVAIVQLKNRYGNIAQRVEYKKFMAAGWKHLGRSWIAASGSTLQMIVYIPKKNKAKR